MRIDTGQVNNILNIIKSAAADNQVLHKGQVFEGKVISREGNALEILTSDGTELKATAENGVKLPINTRLTFEILEKNGETLFIKPVLEQVEKTISKEEMLIGTAADLGLKPSLENVNYLDRGGYLFGKNLDKLFMAVKQDGRADVLGKFQEILVNPDKLLDYIKGFDNENGAKLLKQLGELLQELKKGDIPQKVYTQLVGDIVKGLSVQVNNNFPLLFIPVPLNINNQPQYGEIWVEKDGEGEGQNKDSLNIHISVETPSLGRIEANIRGSEESIDLNLYCSKEVVSTFTGYLNDLKLRISALGINVRSIGVSELKRNSTFLELVQKYVTPFKPVDVKV